MQDHTQLLTSSFCSIGSMVSAIQSLCGRSGLSVEGACWAVHWAASISIPDLLFYTWCVCWGYTLRCWYKDVITWERGCWVLGVLLLPPSGCSLRCLFDSIKSRSSLSLAIEWLFGLFHTLPCGSVVAVGTVQKEVEIVHLSLPWLFLSFSM